jgi:hypothetical protein
VNGIFIIPTGTGATIGGHAGDAVCSVNLIASLCDKLVINPNAVNASDINEAAPNTLYVEGSCIDRFVQGSLGLRFARANRILLVANGPLHPNTVNSANAARVALGVEIETVELREPLTMKAQFNPDGSAGGEVTGWQALVEQVQDHEFDCLAIQSPIDVDQEVALQYLRRGSGVNPWGGIEAKASKLIADAVGKPVAHAPIDRPDNPIKKFTEVVNPRLSAELVSYSYVHCVLKGLARAPRLVVHEGRPARYDLGVEDVDFLITPDLCCGPVHEAAIERGLEVMVVRENRTVVERPFPRDKVTFVESYLEAAGLIACRRIGINERWCRPDRPDLAARSIETSAVSRPGDQIKL